MLTLLFLAAGFVFLVKGADVLVEGSCSLARRFRVSDLVVGLTVVAFGTSSPEMFVTVVATAKGNADIAFGNVLGSNIANVLLVLGISAVIRPLTVGRSTVTREIPASLFAAVLLWVLHSDPFSHGAHALSRADGLVFLGFFALFLLYSCSISRDMCPVEAVPHTPVHSPFRSALMVAAGLALLALGGHLIVESAVKIALWAGLPESVVGLTIVAVGTSLPEMATSAMAALKGKADIAVGNILGSNIFNIFLVLGVSALVRPLPFITASNPDLAVMVSSNVLLLAFMVSGRKGTLDKGEGAAFLVLYFGYIAFLLKWHG